MIPPEWRMLYSLNPIVAVIDGFRWCILGQSDFYWPGFLIGLAERLVDTLDCHSSIPQSREEFCGPDLVC